MSKRYKIEITIKPRVHDSEINDEVMRLIDFAKSRKNTSVLSVPSQHTKEILIDTTDYDDAAALKFVHWAMDINVPGVIIKINF